MASREELLQNINLSMKLDKGFFLRIYGYEITWPGFAETALQRLEVLGCSKARTYYIDTVTEYERKQVESVRPVAEWYAKKLKEEWEQERGGNRWKRATTEDLLLRKKELLLMRKSLI